MSQWFTLTLTLLFSSVAVSDARALGNDYSREELGQKGQLVKGQTPVHGYWVNWEDTFFYSGDTAELNRFLEAYGKLSTGRRVVIHPGTRKARSPWDRADRDIPIDWSYYRSNAKADARRPVPNRLDIWLGSRIKLEELRIPEGVEVVSGGEIEQFVERSQKQAAIVVAPDEVIRQAGRGFLKVEFNVASAGWTLAPRIPGQPRGPVVLELGEKLKNGGRFYVMLWGDAVGASEDARTKELKGKRVRAVGRIQVANPQSASTDYYITIDRAADLVIVK